MTVDKHYRVRFGIRWLTTCLLTGFGVYVFLAPSRQTAVEDLSRFFGGTELTDVIGHVTLFGLLTSVWYTALMLHISRRRALNIAVIVGITLGITTELLQVFVPFRGSNFFDLVANVLGTALAAFIIRRR